MVCLPIPPICIRKFLNNVATTIRHYLSMVSSEFRHHSASYDQCLAENKYEILRLLDHSTFTMFDFITLIIILTDTHTKLATTKKSSHSSRHFDVRENYFYNTILFINTRKTLSLSRNVIELMLSTNYLTISHFHVLLRSETWNYLKSIICNLSSLQVFVES